MSRRIYAPFPTQTIPDPLEPGKSITVRRWKLNDDMPCFDIEAGAHTGYVDAGIDLSRAKDVWVGYDAIVYGSVKLSNKVRIDDQAIVRGPYTEKPRKYALRIRDNVSITESAILGYGERVCDFNLNIDTNVVIKGKARIELPLMMRDEIFIDGEVIIEGKAKFFDNIIVKGNSHIGKKAVLDQDIYVSDNAVVGNNACIQYSLRIENDIKILPFTKIQEGRLLKQGTMEKDGKMIFDAHKVLAENITSKNDLPQGSKIESVGESKQPNLVKEASTKRQRWEQRFSDLMAAMDAYESDIVNIIKYPIMSDLTDPLTAAMVFARREVKYSLDAEEDEFIAAVMDLEQKFLIAESNARKITQTTLTKDELESTQQARKLFAIACNESATENEKSMALKRGFKRLEGIIAVPDKAIHAMTAKSGLAELEM